MTKYIEGERAKYWPVHKKLMAQYRDGSHTISTVHSLEWCQNGELNRDGDKPARIWADGGLGWWQNGLRHRDGDLPAVIDADGVLEWWQNNERHRFNGPAVIYPNGRQEWWINHKNITLEVNEWLAGEEWQGTPEQIFEFQLRFT